MRRVYNDRTTPDGVPRAAHGYELRPRSPIGSAVETWRRWRSTLWHEDMIERTGLSAVERAITIAVMVSPRYDGTHPWDTTILFLKGSTGLMPDEIADLRQRWADIEARSNLQE